MNENKITQSQKEDLFTGLYIARNPLRPGAWAAPERLGSYGDAYENEVTQDWCDLYEHRFGGFYPDEWPRGVDAFKGVCKALLVQDAVAHCLRPTPRAQGSKSDGESAHQWMLFDRKEVELWARYEERRPGSLDLNKLTQKTEDYLIGQLTHFYYSYGGPGRWFWSSPSMRVSRTRILIHQFGGLDI